MSETKYLTYKDFNTAWTTEEERLIEIEKRYPGGTKFRTEEPLKGYREYVLIQLIEKAKANGVLRDV